MAEIVTPRDLPTELTEITNLETLIEVYNPDSGQNEKIQASNLLSRWQGDPILDTDILIPAGGIADSRGNRVIQKQISWNPYEEWKKTAGLLKFDRGEAGIFKEYENESDPNLNNWVKVSSATTTKVGDWYSVSAGESIATSRIEEILPVSSTKWSGLIELKKDSANACKVMISDGTTDYAINYTFATNIVTTIGAIIVTKINIAPDHVLLLFTISTGAIGTTYYRFYPDNSGTNLATYAKKPQIVKDIDYPVPYVKGIHKADSWVHPVNWDESENWTIDMWFKPNINTGAIIDTRDNNSKNGFLLYFSNGFLYLQTKITSVTTIILSPQPVIMEYSHISLVFEENIRCRVYLNGILAVTSITNVVLTSDIHPLVHIGLFQDGARQINGHIADINIRPTADTSTDHYNSGLPWTNPKDVIASEHAYGLDKNGNLVCETITANSEDAYSVVEQYTIGDQTVTKWSNEDMEIIHKIVITSLPITTLVGSIYTSAVQTPSNFIETFITIPSSITRVGAGSNLIGCEDTISNIYHPGIWRATYGASITVTNVQYITITKGKWK